MKHAGNKKFTEVLCGPKLVRIERGLTYTYYSQLDALHELLFFILVKPHAYIHSLYDVRHDKALFLSVHLSISLVISVKSSKRLNGADGS